MISIKLCLLYTALVIVFDMLDKNRFYSNLNFLVMIITVGSVFILNIIDIVDITLAVTFLFINKYIINNYFYKRKKKEIKNKSYISMPVPLIISGDINYDSLKKIRKNSFWLINNMEKNNLELENIYYAFYMNDETYFIKRS